MTVVHTARPRPVGEVLVERGVLTRAQLDEALAAQKRSPTRKLLGDMLIELQLCTDVQVLEALAVVCAVPFARVTPRLMDGRIATILSREFAEEHNALPLFLVDGVLTVAVAEPSDMFLCEEIAQRTGHTVQVVASPRTDILAAIENAFSSRDGDQSLLRDILAQASDQDDAMDDADADLDLAQAASKDSPVVKLVHHLLVSAVREKASDVHIEPGEDSLRVRFRIDGRLYEKMRPPHAMAPAVVSRIKILASLDIAERRLPQDGAIRMTVDDRSVDLRVSTLPNQFGEKVVLRILDTQNALIGLDRLGMEPEVRAAFEHAVAKPNGMVLVTGPTGSGKTTTLYSALKAIESVESNFCTVEDPIEYNLAGVNQFQTHERIGRTFPALLRSLLRQDPDVIMVGEIRDPETCRIAVQAALTGHLLLSTLHTNNAVGAVTRLLNLGAEPYLISASLEAVLAQRLVRRICTHCKTEGDVPSVIREVLEPQGIEVSRMTVGRGCAECQQSGMRGRIGLYEIFIPTDQTRGAIAHGATMEELHVMAVANGMKPLNRSGLDKAVAGETTFEEILRVIAL